jgi:hypothetical protein
MREVLKPQEDTMQEYENLRMRQGLGAADDGAETGVVVALCMSAAGLVIVAVFIWWVGRMGFWR